MQINSNNRGNEPTTIVQIAGHYPKPDRMTKEQLIQYLSDHETHWVFVSGQLMQPSQLAEADWQTIGTVRVTPGLRGGSA
jgi:hypothetical protein